MTHARQGDTVLGTRLITGERRLVFVKSWLQMGRRRDRAGKCERTVGTGRLADECPRAPQGSPRVCWATEPRTWRPQGRGSRPPGWHTESWRCPGWARTRGGGHCVTTPESRPRGGRQEVLAPRLIKGRALQDATLVSGVWGPSRSRGPAPTAPASGKGPDLVRAPLLSHTLRAGALGRGCRPPVTSPARQHPRPAAQETPPLWAGSLQGPRGLASLSEGQPPLLPPNLTVLCSGPRW